MYRTAEQIKQYVQSMMQMNADPYEPCDGYISNALDDILRGMELRDGDELTGLQILAQLPVEEQERFTSKCPCDFDIQIHLQDKLTQNCYANGIGPKWENCTACWVHCLERIYVYRNGKFEPKE